jgi:hypothetical protein
VLRNIFKLPRVYWVFWMQWAIPDKHSARSVATCIYVNIMSLIFSKPDHFFVLLQHNSRVLIICGRKTMGKFVHLAEGPTHWSYLQATRAEPVIATCRLLFLRVSSLPPSTACRGATARFSTIVSETLSERRNWKLAYQHCPNIGRHNVLHYPPFLYTDQVSVNHKFSQFI